MFRQSRVIPILILINIAVFVAWNQIGDTYFKSNYMMRNYLVSWDLIADGRYWTLITSEFSHNMLMHLLINMFVLYQFGPVVEKVLGSFHFLSFYLIAAVSASLGHIFVSSLILHQPEIPALGASGAISGMVVLFAALFPKEKIFIMGVLPLPAFFGVLAFVGFDLWGIFAQAQGGGLSIGHGAHLGGALMGAIFYFAFGNIYKTRVRLLRGEV